MKRKYVRDVMGRRVQTINEGATLAEAATKMLSNKVSSLIVMPEGKEEPYGILTSKDIVNAYAEGRDLKTVQVKYVASTPLVVVTPGVPIEYAARLMRKTELRHLAVFNGREIIGVLSNLDVMRGIVASP